MTNSSHPTFSGDFFFPSELSPFSVDASLVFCADFASFFGAPANIPAIPAGLDGLLWFVPFWRGWNYQAENKSFNKAFIS